MEDIDRNNANEEIFKNIERKYIRKITEEEMLQEERELDEIYLEHKIKIKDIIIKTFGELRPYIKSTKAARKFEHVLTDSEFRYFYNWILEKELKENKFDFNSK